jgi:hypothetical protein
LFSPCNAGYFERVSSFVKCLCQKLAIVFQRVGRLILATEQSDPTLAVSGQISDWRCRTRYQQLHILFFDTSTQAVHVSRTCPQTKTSMFNIPRGPQAGQFLFFYRQSSNPVRKTRCRLCPLRRKPWADAKLCRTSRLDWDCAILLLE